MNARCCNIPSPLAAPRQNLSLQSQWLQSTFDQILHPSQSLSNSEWDESLASSILELEEVNQTLPTIHLLHKDLCVVRLTREGAPFESGSVTVGSIKTPTECKTQATIRICLCFTRSMQFQFVAESTSAPLFVRVPAQYLLSFFSSAGLHSSLHSFSFFIQQLYSVFREQQPSAAMNTTITVPKNYG